MKLSDVGVAEVVLVLSVSFIGFLVLRAIAVAISAFRALRYMSQQEEINFRVVTVVGHKALAEMEPRAIPSRDVKDKVTAEEIQDAKARARAKLHATTNNLLREMAANN